MKPDLPIILLAAGAAARMRGRDKLLEPVDGMSLLRRQAEMARRVTMGPVLVTLPPPPHARYGELEGMDVSLIVVPNPEEGMNASIRAGFAALPEGTERAMVLLADLPELTENDLNEVIHAAVSHRESSIIRGMTEDGKQGHPIIFTAPLFPELTRLTGDSGGREVVAQNADSIALVPLPGQHARLDLDTPEDWAAWRRENPDR
ncbi:NTP transferase domain-containing protein [Sulfitobacter sp. BDSS02]|nr:NTP transferase domain-containing protein [Sulfitobacter sp. BDSS02]MBR9849366.1 nucleotidyltransferase family protein [Paracoccaceae bacterium]